MSNSTDISQQFESFLYTPYGVATLAAVSVLITSFVWSMGCCIYCCWQRRRRLQQDGVTEANRWEGKAEEVGGGRGGGGRGGGGRGGGGKGGGGSERGGWGSHAGYLLHFTSTLQQISFLFYRDLYYLGVSDPDGTMTSGYNTGPAGYSANSLSTEHATFHTSLDSILDEES